MITKTNIRSLHYGIFLVLTIIFALTGASYLRNAVWSDEVASLEDAVRKSSNKGRVHYNLAIAYETKGLQQKAIEEYGAAISLQPGRHGAYVGRGRVYRKQGDYDKAFLDLYSAISLTSGFAPAYLQLGLAYVGLGEYETAVRYYSRAIVLDPVNTLTYNNRGTAFARMGKYDRAIMDFDQALLIDPENQDARINRQRAISILKNGRY